MANLRVDKITSTETFETTGSVQFDGANSGLTISDNTDFDLGTGDFTIEGWYYIENVGVYLSLFDWRGSGGDGNYPALFRNNTGNYIYYYVNSTVRITNVNIDYNTWFHITVCRSSGITRLFLNGNEKGSFVDNTNYVSRDILLGLSQSSSNDLKGHISNYRVIKGKALYTENFTPPTRELTVTPETVLLCCQHKTDATHEKTGKTITVNGNAVANELTPGLLTDRVKSGGSSAITGSVEFDGTGDYLSLSNVSDFRMGSDDFTVECWIYPTSTGANKGIVGIWNSTSGRTWLLYNSSSLQPVFILDGDGVGGGEAQITGNVIALNQWTHLAGVRYGANMFLYVNGVNVGTTAAVTVFNNTSDPLEIGRFNSANDFQGFISNVRVIKGTALYTANFIPPTRELKKVPGTVLLCCQDENSVTTEATGKTITSNGDPAASNFTPQVGNDGSVEFVGPIKINTENYFYLPTGNTEDRGRGRGIIFGGYTSPSSVNNIQYVTIQSTGNAQDFGDLTVAASISGAVSSSTRGISAGGFVTPSPATYSQTIDFVTISTTGNAIKFGDLQGQRGYIAGFSNSTRGIFVSGYKQTPAPAGTTGETDYITIASLGNTQDFGTATFGYYQDAGCSSSTRGLVAGVNNPGGGGHTTNIQYLTIATTGNTQTFGDLTQSRRGLSATSSSTRAVFCGGYTGPASQFNTIDYVTIASTGNAQDFGDAVFAGSYSGATSNSIRGVFINGYTPSLVNHIDYITISTTGNAQDFGDSLIIAYSPSGCSDSHGGLG